MSKSFIEAALVIAAGIIAARVVSKMFVKSTPAA